MANTYVVLEDFIDKNTDELHKKGTNYPSPSEKRAKELIKLGFIEKEEPNKNETSDKDESSETK